MDDIVLERIRAWEAAGLLDAETAARLRAAEATGGAVPAVGAVPASPSEAERPAHPSIAGGAASLFGPGLALVEMFGYVGAGFLLAAWSVLMVRLVSEAERAAAAWLTVGSMAVPAAVFFALGVLLHGRSAREGRAAGVAFLLSTVFVTAGVQANLSIVGDFGVWVQSIAVGVGLLVAIAYRWLHPSLLTEFGLLAWATALVGAWLEAAASFLAPDGSFGIFGFDRNSALALAVLSAIAWSATAVGFGMIGLAEARDRSVSAGRRASLARFWAGVVLVSGIAYSVMRSFYDENANESVRVLPPWVSVLLVLGVSAILVERAFRREAGAYVFAAALGLIIALSDLNATYVVPTGGTEVALVVEGLLLIAAAFAAERLSGRVGGDGPAAPA